MDPVLPVLSLAEVKTLDQGPAPLYVLLLPEVPDPSSGVVLPEVQVLAIPILSRQDGLLLAIPSDSLPPEVIYPAEPPPPRALIGPENEVFVQAASDDDAGLEKPLDYQIACLLVDFDTAVLPRLRGLDPVTEGPGIHCFSEGAMEIYPSSSELLTAAYTWFQEEQEGRVAFYSAAEDFPPQQAPTVAKATQAKAKQKQPPPKRITTATLSQQLATLTETIPALSTSLAAMQRRQDQMEQSMAQRPIQPPAPQRQEFGFMTPGAKQPLPSPSQFLRQVGPPPKVRMPQRSKQQEQMPEDEPTAPLEEMDLSLEEGGQQASIAQMLLKQQMALNTLVSHIASQDGFQDLGGSASASSTISLKGSARRDRLLADLAARKSDFFLKVAQNAHRRLKPAEMVPPTLADFPQKALFTKHMEKQGGYTGFQRDQGLTMWLLGHVADQFLMEDFKGAQEMLALAMVAIEQSAMDNGKWEVAWILALQEDPPQQLFAHRPQATNPRLRAFGPLCPADWGATALAYIKELDLLSSRRAEALPKKQGGGKTEEDSGDPAKRPKQPRYPRKPKAQGGQSQAEST